MIALFFFKKKKKEKKNPNIALVRALPSGVLNAKYLAFDTPNTKNQPSSNILNLKNFGMELQYALKYESAGTKMPKIYILILFTFSLSSQHISLSLSLYSSSIACRSHQRLPLDTADLRARTEFHATPHC